MDGLTITHSNERTFGRNNEHFRFEIPEGQIVLYLERVDEACPTRPSCPDTLTVLSLPIGMRAEPVEVTTPEGMSRTIEIHPYNGF